MIINPSYSVGGLFYRKYLDFTLHLSFLASLETAMIAIEEHGQEESELVWKSHRCATIV